MKVTPAALKQVLRKAKTLLRTGWVQKSYETTKVNAKGERYACYCAAGAIEAAVQSIARDNDEIRYALREAAFKAINKTTRNLIRSGEGGVIEWNDKPTRTKQQVVAAFDRAIEAA